VHFVCLIILSIRLATVSPPIFAGDRRDDRRKRRDYSSEDDSENSSRRSSSDDDSDGHYRRRRRNRRGKKVVLYSMVPYFSFDKDEWTHCMEQSNVCAHFVLSSLQLNRGGEQGKSADSLSEGDLDHNIAKIMEAMKRNSEEALRIEQLEHQQQTETKKLDSMC
jgi:hypothetical protein